MAKPQGLPRAPSEYTTDVASRVMKIGPWEAYKPESVREAAVENSMITVARASRNSKRVRTKKPGDINSVDPAKMFEADESGEHVDYRDSAPDRFYNGVGKSYNGFRIAYIEETGYVRIENDGSESMASPSEISRFKRDLADAARIDDEIRRYASEKGII